MTPCAIFFGAIGALTDTSDMQRRAFNAAFADHDLDWEWDRDEYREMLLTPGGLDRIARFAEARDEKVDAASVYHAKVAHFRRMAVEEGLELRDGVAELIAEAKEADVPLGFATATGPDTVDLIFEGLKGKLSREDFAFVGDASMISNPKPAPDIYRIALDALSFRADMCFAIEDTPESALSALAAGIPCVGFPGWAAEGRTFPEEAKMVAGLSPDMVHANLAPPRTAAE